MTSSTQYAFGDYVVSLVHSASSPVETLDDLHICPLGMKFLSSQPFPEFRLYQFEISMRTDGAGCDKRITCAGVVVKSTPEGNAFRSIIQFRDLAAEDSQFIDWVTKTNHMRCADCENC